MPSVICPYCGAVNDPVGPLDICVVCGQKLPDSDTPLGAKSETAAPPNTGRPVAIERPFDIGKPLGTPHPVSQVCPNCGSTEYQAVKPAAMVAFTSDRVCRACSTRYTPPTPIWARIVFGGVGLAAVAFGADMSYRIVQGIQHSTFGLVTPAVVALVGFGCLYKAATK